MCPGVSNRIRSLKPPTKAARDWIPEGKGRMLPTSFTTGCSKAGGPIVKTGVASLPGLAGGDPEGEGSAEAKRWAYIALHVVFL